MDVVKMLDGRRKMEDVCPLLLLTSDFAETTSVSIGCYSYRPYMFGYCCFYFWGSSLRTRFTVCFILPIRKLICLKR